MDNAGFNFFTAMTNPQFAAQQLRTQQQQRIAEQMMQEGSQQDPTAQLANPGGMVIRNSPVAALAKALEKGLGGYMSGKATADQMNSYYGLAGRQTPDQSPDGKGGAPLLPWQTNGVTGQPQGVALGNAIAGDAMSFTPQEAMDEFMQPGRGKAEFEARTAGGVAGAKAGATAPFDTVTLPDGTVVPKTNIVGNPSAPGPAAPPAAAPSINPDAAWNSDVDPMLENNAMPAPVNPNSPEGAAHAAELKANATKSGENAAEAQKNVAAINSTIESQINNLETLKKLSARMPDRGPHDTEVWLSKHMGTQDMSSADADFNTLNKQMFVNGLMGSIPPGSRLDIPIVKALQGAKEVDPTLDNKSRVAVINRHIQTLRDAQQNAAKNYGILSGKPQAAPIAPPAAPSAVTHVWTPNGIQPVGGQ